MVGVFYPGIGGEISHLSPHSSQQMQQSQGGVGLRRVAVEKHRRRLARRLSWIVMVLSNAKPQTYVFHGQKLDSMKYHEIS